MQNRDSRFERLHDSAIASPGPTQGSCLVFKNGHDRFDRVAILELMGERVLGQCRPRLLLVVSQSGLEKGLKTR